LINFYNFLPIDSVKNLLLSGMRTTPTMSLHYLVKHPKITNIHGWAEGVVVNSKSI